MIRKAVIGDIEGSKSNMFCHLASLLVAALLARFLSYWATTEDGDHIVC